MIHINETNPNPHEHSLCGNEDCSGPYIVFSAHEMDDPMNPHPVICAHHLFTDIVPMMEQWEADSYIDADSVDEDGVNPMNEPPDGYRFTTSSPEVLEPVPEL